MKMLAFFIREEFYQSILMKYLNSFIILYNTILRLKIIYTGLRYFPMHINIMAPKIFTQKHKPKHKLVPLRAWLQTRDMIYFDA